jgi:RNA polymerase sigma-70 factor (ECF subfamily)
MAPRFEELIDRHHDELFAYLWRLLGKERQSDVTLDVEDLTQEVFARAYEAFPRLRENSNHRAWLYKIATNCAFTKLRRIKSRREKMLALEASAAARDHSSIGENMASRVRDIVNALPVKQKACLTLRYLEDLDYPEIAEIVGCTDVSARANVYQAIRSLRRALKEER